MRAGLLATFCLGLLAWAAPLAYASDSGQPTRHTILADGHPLALWEKRPASVKGAVLLIHGRTWSALPNFDLRVPGEDRSVMNGFVRAGYVAYALDLRGYGASLRDDTGWLTPARAVADVHTALEWIRSRHPEVTRAPVLVGYSRGASVSMMLAQEHPETIAALILYGLPTARRQATSPTDAPPRQPNTAAAAASDFITPGAASPAVIDAYVKQTLASDPVRVDWKDEDQFVYAPERVRVPTLFLYGARDPWLVPEAVTRLFTSLGTPDRAWILLPDSDHAAHVENTHRAWLHAIVSFIERPREEQP